VKSGAAGVDFTGPAPSTSKYYYSTTFTTTDSKWSISEQEPSNWLYAPIVEASPDAPEFPNGGGFQVDPDSAMIVWWPAIATIVFGFAVKKAVQANFVAAIKFDFEKVYKGVTVSFKGEYVLSCPRFLFLLGVVKLLEHASRDWLYGF
jgi:hypothetical protein